MGSWPLRTSKLWTWTPARAPLVVWDQDPTYLGLYPKGIQERLDVGQSGIFLCFCLTSFFAMFLPYVSQPVFLLSKDGKENMFPI